MTVTPRAGAVVLALGATLGAGVLVGFGPAAALAGPWFLPALALAAVAALCCAYSTADQHRAYPDAAGGYSYIRHQLGPWPARIGASAHLVGRAGLAAALAGAFGAYAFPADRVVAGVVLLVVVGGLGRFAAGWIGLAAVVVVLVALGVVVAVAFSVAPPANPPGGEVGFDGVMGAAGLLFAVFTGFERVTAPERGDPVFPARALRAAVPVLVGVVLVVALAVGWAVLRQLGPARLALSPAPLRDALAAADGRSLVPVLAVGVLVAAGSALVFVLASARRTLRGLVEHGDLPRVRADWPLDVVAVGLALVVFLALPTGTALAVGACGTAFYYGFTNASARVLLHEERTWPMRTACLGLGLCVLLAMSAPTDALLLTAAALAAGTALLSLNRVRRRIG
ncbi:amino acid permease [Saccharothrix obliqua]|uniref:amino acid permease n=1 Tax=Saccharothrix obliqua TaxID=2861747 RepID=UPI001C605609|nr:amino acid permease [Saccharothrix obliqua]MBW4721686.1 amino acid permease [Saccharothrix obliqua]